MATNPDNVGGQRPSDQAIAAAFWELSDKAFQTKDDEWVFPVLNLISDRAAELCRAAPAGGDGQQEMLACKACECDWPDYLLREGTCLKCRKDSAPAGGDPDNLQLPIRVSVSDGRFVAESLRPSGDVAIDSSSIYSKSIGEDDAVPTDADSAPAGSGEVERLVKLFEEIGDSAQRSLTSHVTVSAKSLRDAAALLRKLQQGAE